MQIVKDWSFEEEDQLLDLWNANIAALRSPKRKDKIYQLKDVLSEKTKISRTAAVFKAKMKQMEAEYKKIDNASGSSPSKWPHYSKVRKIFHERHDINKEDAFISDSIEGDNAAKKSSEFNINRGKPRVSAQVQKVNETSEQLLQTFQEMRRSFVERVCGHFILPRILSRLIKMLK